MNICDRVCENQSYVHINIMTLKLTLRVILAIGTGPQVVYKFDTRETKHRTTNDRLLAYAQGNL